MNVDLPLWFKPVIPRQKTLVAQTLKLSRHFAQAILGEVSGLLVRFFYQARQLIIDFYQNVPNPIKCYLST
jgi:hypothetical protein